MNSESSIIHSANHFLTDRLSPKQDQRFNTMTKLLAYSAYISYFHEIIVQTQYRTVNKIPKKTVCDRFAWHALFYTTKQTLCFNILYRKIIEELSFNV